MFDDLSLNARGRLPTWPGDGLGRAIHPYEESSGAWGKPQIISEGHFPLHFTLQLMFQPAIQRHIRLYTAPLQERMQAEFYCHAGLSPFQSVLASRADT